ncbi:hypothetical protein FQN53_004382 [Emmonsiellopsis sp. PD_33]|nr:hypothetical protein FQN53_004382 [Emmonsiellopsis sp. PD_33]
MAQQAESSIGQVPDFQADNIFGIPNALAALDNFTGFQAAHIYPHAREAEWITRNYQSWITDTAPASQIGSSGIHSCQNGILLNASLHTLFDTYAVAVNPDDGYKVISFVPDSFAVDGRILEPRCRDLDDPNRISDDALRWHFQQAILAHVRGMGQRYWETDFPDGDMIGEIMGGPDAAERMEVELFTRLGCGDDAYG